MQQYRSSIRTWSAVVLLLVPAVCQSVEGCPANWCQVFTAGSSADVQAGIIDILTGLVNGAFALLTKHIDPPSDTQSTGTPKGPSLKLTFECS
jgi:hypothetical protein